MTANYEDAIRVAVDELVAALRTALREEAALVGSQPERLLSIAEGAAALGIGRTALYAELMGGRLVSLKVGRRRLVPASAIDAYIANQSLARAGRAAGG